MLRKLYKIMRKKFIPMSQYPDYLRKSGMKIGENCEIFKSANFGSEPYLVTLGNHVRINDGVKLITHDGGYWVLRSEYADKARKKAIPTFGMDAEKKKKYICSIMDN